MAAVKKANAELADLADTAAADAGRLLANAKRALRKARTIAAQRKVHRRPDPVAGRRRGRLVRAVNDLEELLEATRRIAAQTRQRLAGVTPDGSTRRVSLHDPDARPIAKGRLGKPVERSGDVPERVKNEAEIVLGQKKLFQRFVPGLVLEVMLELHGRRHQRTPEVTAPARSRRRTKRW